MNRLTVSTAVVALLFALLHPPAAAGEVELSGFLQGLYGAGTDAGNPVPSDLSAAETRLQLRLESFADGAAFFGRLDFVYEDYLEPRQRFELREGYAKITLFERLDLKIGRQIATWGTGDMVFVNDLFAKDYRSFFSGRDDQYLKAPQNALRAELYTGLGGFTVVYTPRFTPNRVPTGERLSYYDPLAGGIVGGGDVLFEGRLPGAELGNGEAAVRFSRYVRSLDVAVYFYRGFYKDPVAMDMATFEAYHPALQATGFSFRLPALGGIAWLEGGLYDSLDDDGGNDPAVPNSSMLGLAGFERQITPVLTANVQYLAETMLDHDRYAANLAPGLTAADETRHLVTSRVTARLFMENLELSGFGFWSPSDEDRYVRVSASYRYTDAVTLALGANLFGGDAWTPFGGFDRNDNVWAKITYGF